MCKYIRGLLFTFIKSYITQLNPLTSEHYYNNIITTPYFLHSILILSIMASTNYNYILPAESYDSYVGNIRVRWSNSAMDRLRTEAGESGVPVTTMKALCEHLAYSSAYRLQNDQALIRYEALAQESLYISHINLLAGFIS